MKLIGINGRLKAGKDTACELLAKNLPDERVVMRAGFADKMKLSAARAIGFNPSSVEDAVRTMNALKEGVISVAMPLGKPGLRKQADGTLSMGQSMHSHQIDGRQYQQLYGTESHRDVFGVDFWVDALLPRLPFASSPSNSQVLAQKTLATMYAGADLMVITDVRFPNEAKRILDLGGEVWHLNAEARLGPLPADAHESEQPLPDALVTNVIFNNGTLEQLAAKMAEVAVTVEASL